MFRTFFLFVAVWDTCVVLINLFLVWPLVPPELITIFGDPMQSQLLPIELCIALWYVCGYQGSIERTVPRLDYALLPS